MQNFATKKFDECKVYTQVCLLRLLLLLHLKRVPFKENVHYLIMLMCWCCIAIFRQLVCTLFNLQQTH